MNQPTPPHTLGAHPSLNRDVVALLLLAIVWGGSIPVTKLGLRDLDPLTLTALRYIFAAPLFFGMVRRHWAALRPHAGTLIWLGLLNAIPGQLFQTLGVEHTSSTAATLLNATVPLWFVGLASLRLGQRLRHRQVGGLLLALLGVSLIFVNDVSHIRELWSGGNALGNLLMLLSAASVAGYYVLSVSLAERLTPLPVAAATTVVGAIALLPFWLWAEYKVGVTWTPVGVAMALYLAILVTYLGLQIWFSSLQRVPASLAGALQYLQPVVGLILSALVLGEALSARFVAGALLVLAGIGVVSAGAGGRRG